MVDFGYDISDYFAIQPEYGTMADFEALVEEARKIGVRVIMDFVPNHTSDQCEWFVKSVNREPGYEDFYIWHDGYENPADTDDRLPPNNWVSVFHGSAWTYHPQRKQFYLHQFTKEQPDLNFRNPAVVEKMKEVMRFWLAKGVAGFRIDDTDPFSYGFLHHHYTKDLPEVYDMILEWRAVLDEWTAVNGGESKIMMMEAYANISFTMRYYEYGSHLPFNFLLITDLKWESTAQDFVYVINKWLTYMPRGRTANWVIGNHDNPRVGSRFVKDRIDGINTLVMTLPGVGITYNGEEFGMLDNRDITWDETKDPAALNTGPEVFMDYTRDPERAPFQWNDDENAGFSTGLSTWLPVNKNYKTLNLEHQKRMERSHFKFYQELVKLRDHDTLKYGGIQLVPYNQNVLTYIR
jgi:alpha-glucosidase